MDLTYVENQLKKEEDMIAIASAQLAVGNRPQLSVSHSATRRSGAVGRLHFQVDLFYCLTSL